MKQVKRERAGLLWRLLPASARRKIAAYLTLSELQDLNESYRQYTKQDPARRRTVQMELSGQIRTRRSIWPAAVSLSLTLISVFLWIVQGKFGMSESLRLALFGPLVMTAASPLSLYFLSPVRLRMLFRLPQTFESVAVCIVTMVFLIWLLYLIGESGGGVLRVDRLTFVVLILGAMGAPLLEEVLFRELIPSMAPDILAGHALAVPIFAIAHFPDSPSMFALYLLAGGFLSMLRIQSGGLLLPLVAHAMANGIVTAARFG